MKSVFLIALLAMISCADQQSELRVWQSIEQTLQTQLITIQDGDTLDLPEGNFMFTKSLAMDGKSNVVIRGKGMDKTILSFKNQTEGAQGLLITNGNNISLVDFSIEDAIGDNLKVSEVRGITLKRIRSVWADGPKTENGAYALYPVLCKQVLIDECIAMGSADAGIYVGQSDSVIIRNSKAYWNVAGIESENSRWVEIYGNEAYENTGGILVFDLPGLTQYGHTTKVYNNRVHDNNHENFAAKGNIVASIPPGTGLMILATHDLELTKNEITDNKTIGVGIISYELVAALNEGEVEQESSIGGVQTVDNNFRTDTLYNPFPYQIYIHENKFENSHWFPALGHDIGKLFFMKSFMNPPDIAYDGIEDPKRADRGLCVQEGDKVNVINLDAANDFKSLKKDARQFDCAGVKISKR
ncbi:MAG: right-handed parallel beta-helix repeat-containing protein [Cyclobacteriaceae bacterium]|nr:right-handed parallel beta-helix repeat-containing protein [Cyclobacteriaceae bacterium]